MAMPEDQQSRPFVVLFMERSGSTYVVEALSSHPEARVEFELFVEWSKQKNTRQLQLQKARDYLTAPSAFRAVGFKTKLKDIPDQQAFGELLKEIGARVICSVRRNRIKHVVSHLNAVRLHERTGDWNLYDEADRPASFRIDPSNFAERLEAFETQRAALIDYTIKLERPTLYIQYEELMVGHDLLFEMVFGFLGLPPMPVRGKSLKNTGEDLRDVVENFEELRLKYAGTRYEALFEEVLK